ncbi:MAG: septum formation initiator family protein [Kiritimatiellaeota bacterium]|nr:septum formation initiator family protein [Kiritimatiellota bacterium]
MKPKTYLWFGILLALAVGDLYFILPAYRGYRNACEDVTDLKRHLMQQRQDIQRLEREIRALRADPRAVERVAREKFGWCRDGEKIYHFEAEAPTAGEPPLLPGKTRACEKPARVSRK